VISGPFILSLRNIHFSNGNGLFPFCAHILILLSPTRLLPALTMSNTAISAYESLQMSVRIPFMASCTRYNIMFISDIRQVGGFLREF